MRVPAFKESGLSKYLVDLQQQIESDMRGKMDKNTANHSVLLQSSGNKVYEITVDDAGVLVTTLIHG